MRSPFELAYRYVEPALRREVARKLADLGMPRIEIARRLGVSPAAVTKYLNGEDHARLALGREEVAELEELVEGISAGLAGPEDVEGRLARLALKVMASGGACALHAEIDPEVDPSRCRICRVTFLPLLGS
ncbi:MAG: helix-turn-helix domain-containing protein [Desulfurococcaceae archaeon]